MPCISLVMKISISKVSIFFSVIILTSCGYIAREIFTPKTCKNCEILDSYGNVVKSYDDCGGGVFNMELRTKAEAYDYGCGYRVNCTTYQREVPEASDD